MDNEEDVNTYRIEKDFGSDQNDMNNERNQVDRNNTTHQNYIDNTRNQDDSTRQCELESDKGNEMEDNVSTKFINRVLTTAGHDDVNAIRQLIAGQSDDVLNSKNLKGRTLLMLGAKDGHTAIVDILLCNDQVRQHINMKDVNGQTALMMAALHGHLDCTKRLLSTSDIDAKLTDKDGQTPFMLAAKNGHLECVCCLLDYAKLTSNSNDWEGDRKIAFLLTAMKGHTNCVGYLWRVVMIDVFNAEFHSALVLALSNLHLDCVHYLIGLKYPDNTCNMGEVSGDDFQKKETLRYLQLFKRYFFDAHEKNEEEKIMVMIDTAYELYHGIVSSSHKVLFLLLCTITILNKPTDCICCLCESAKVKPKLFKLCQETVIALAVANSHVDCVKHLLEIDGLFVSFETIVLALVVAVCKGSFECFRFLMEFSMGTGYETVSETHTQILLSLAAVSGQVECVKYLLEAGKVNIKQEINENGDNAFLLSAMMGRVECVKYLFNTGKVDINQQRRSGETAFMLSASNGHIECVRYLLDAGKVDINQQRRSGETAFMLSASNGHIECVRYLLDAGNVDINRQNLHGDTALMLSASNGHLECVKYLIDTGNLDIDKQNQSGFTALMLSAWNGHVECVQYLLDTGKVDINQRNEFGESAFLLSASQGHVECVKYFLDTWRVDINQQDNEGKTAFLSFAWNGNSAFLQYILDTYEVDVNQRDEFGDNALMLSAYHGHAECTKHLLDTCQVDINRQNRHGDTALILSAKFGHIECVKHLLATGKVDINQQNKTGFSALMLSARNGHIECVKHLLDTGKVDINQQNNHRLSYGHTAFMFSAEIGNVECIKHFLNTGKVNVNQQNKDGYTAFMLSAMNGHVECVKYLHGTRKVDTNQQNKDGYTAFVLSVQHGHINCVAYFLASAHIDKDHHKQCGIEAIQEAVSKNNPECLFLLLNHYGHCLCNAMKDIFLKNSHSSNQNLAHVSPFIKARLFDWSWYPGFPPTMQGFLARKLVTNGYAPREFEWKGKQSSPLHHAFMINDVGLARYLIANLYLTSFDVENFQKDKNLQSHVNLNGSESLKALHRQLFSSPWNLKALSLLKISCSLRNEHREIDISQELKEWLTEDFRSLLGFEHRIRWLCRRQWEFIDVGFLLNGRCPKQLNQHNSCQGTCNNFCMTLREST